MRASAALTNNKKSPHQKPCYIPPQKCQGPAAFHVSRVSPPQCTDQTHISDHVVQRLDQALLKAPVRVRVVTTIKCVNAGVSKLQLL
jgi:hypothetical protein